METDNSRSRCGSAPSSASPASQFATDALRDFLSLNFGWTYTTGPMAIFDFEEDVMFICTWESYVRTFAFGWVVGLVSSVLIAALILRERRP